MSKRQELIDGIAYYTNGYWSPTGLLDYILDILEEPGDEQVAAFHSLTDDNGNVLVKTGYKAMINVLKETK